MLHFLFMFGSLSLTKKRVISIRFAVSNISKSALHQDLHFKVLSIKYIPCSHDLRDDF